MHYFKFLFIEIASHTVTHPNMSELSGAEQEKELVNSKKTIDTKIEGQQCLTIAYPFCIPSEFDITCDIKRFQGKPEIS